MVNPGKSILVSAFKSGNSDRLIFLDISSEADRWEGVHNSDFDSTEDSSMEYGRTDPVSLLDPSLDDPET